MVLRCSLFLVFIQLFLLTQMGSSDNFSEFFLFVVTVLVFYSLHEKLHCLIVTTSIYNPEDVIN
jgi:hypothetical protein